MAALGAAKQASPLLPPHPDVTRARDCEQCLGWGTLVTRDGDHELCHACQPGNGDDEDITATGSQPPHPRCRPPARTDVP
ncbi:hypothetical protein D9753_33655 [Streptomyces dangxiongensis]|uniref:Uncharacterized protein n=1 Tax=Streptomyces dangxiongensis TaxID=1442032 RepID=A0A3G2JKZ2_9ACTN|nr:hypothetical protein [Streptomyces dangxiongensis]AYN43014.1 hypothetical protein D9753_33655 [Streptomyces dangxiongensis]